MQLGNLTRIISQNLRRNRKNFAFSAVGIVVGISSFVFFIALGSGIKHVVATEIFPVDANRIQVVPRTAQFGSLAGGRVIDDQALADFAALRGVAGVYPRMQLSFLATSSVDGRRISPLALELLSKLPGVTPQMIQAVRGVRMWLEIMGTGIDPKLVTDDVVTGEFKDVGEDKPIPILLSRQMIEIYNASFAESRSLPKINEKLLPFLPAMPLTLNHSFLSRNRVRGSSVQTKMKVVGLSRHALLGGITMPLETARKYNQRFSTDHNASLYDGAILELSSSSFLGSVQEQIQKMGFDIDVKQRRMAESVGLAVTLVTLGFTLISLIIVCIAAVNISHTFFMIIYERRRELGLLRALGATRSDVRRIILGEASLIGVVGGSVRSRSGTDCDFGRGFGDGAGATRFSL